MAGESLEGKVTYALPNVPSSLGPPMVKLRTLHKCLLGCNQTLPLSEKTKRKKIGKKGREKRKKRKGTKK